MPAFSQKEKLALLPQACIDKVPNSPADSIRSHFKIILMFHSRFF